ncbi:hypothetical protein U1Q18_019290 [Sarracenia purpurea var. burkii]
MGQNPVTGDSGRRERVDDDTRGRRVVSVVEGGSMVVMASEMEHQDWGRWLDGGFVVASDGGARAPLTACRYG